MGQAPPAIGPELKDGPGSLIGKPCAAREPQAEVSRGSRGSSSRSGALQLFVLVHGICGSSRDWEVWKNRLELRRRADWEVRASDSITPFSYFGGYEVHKLGELLAKQVAEWARAALPRICEWDLPGVVHGHFVTLNTPHLGVRGANLWMCWKNMGVLIPIKSFNQIHQLTLQDERSDVAPLREESGSSFGRRSARLLEELADPQSRQGADPDCPRHCGRRVALGRDRAVFHRGDLLHQPVSITQHLCRASANLLASGRSRGLQGRHPAGQVPPEWRRGCRGIREKCSPECSDA
ncbi:unnamed protein product [Effrenium voratum]|nr:unnamed protein product [Effrenium voratum]